MTQEMEGQTDFTAVTTTLQEANQGKCTHGREINPEPNGSLELKNT